MNILMPSGGAVATLPGCPAGSTLQRSHPHGIEVLLKATERFGRLSHPCRAGNNSYCARAAGPAHDSTGRLRGGRGGAPGRLRRARRLAPAGRRRRRARCQQRPPTHRDCQQQLRSAWPGERQTCSPGTPERETLGCIGHRREGDAQHPTKRASVTSKARQMLAAGHCGTFARDPMFVCMDRSSSHRAVFVMLVLACDRLSDLHDTSRTKDDSLITASHRLPCYQGITADVDGVPVAVGNLRLLAANTQQDLPASVSAADGDWRAQGMTVVWVAVSGRAAGAIVVSDAPRKEAAEAVAALQSQKLHCVMLTGALPNPTVGRFL